MSKPFTVAVNTDNEAAAALIGGCSVRTTGNTPDSNNGNSNCNNRGNSKNKNRGHNRIRATRGIVNRTRHTQA